MNKSDIKYDEPLFFISELNKNDELLEPSENSYFCDSIYRCLNFLPEHNNMEFYVHCPEDIDINSKHIYTMSDIGLDKYFCDKPVNLICIGTIVTDGKGDYEWNKKYLDESVIYESKKYGVPEIKRYPLNTDKELEQAIKNFKYCPDKYKDELAINISRRLIGYDKLNDDSEFTKYYKDNSKKYKEEVVEEESVTHPMLLEGTYEDELEILKSLSDKDKNFVIPNNRFIDSPWVIYRKVYKDGKTNMGFLEAYNFPTAWRQVRITITIKEKYRGNGLAEQMVQELKDTISDNKDIHTLIWGTDKDNIKSNKIAKKCGFKLKYKTKSEDNVYYFDMEKYHKKNNVLQEAGLTSKERKELPDSEFGIPELRKYPLTDKEHVEQAIRYFNKCPKGYEKELASNIKKNIVKYGMKPNIGDNNNFKNYYNESSLPDDIAEFLKGNSEEYKQLIVPKERRGRNIYYDTHPEEAPINESASNSLIVKKLLKLNKELNLYEYGLPVDGIIKDVSSEEMYYKYYRYLSPAEFKKLKGGICWDYVGYQDYVLEMDNIKHDNYFIMDKEYHHTHTITIVNDDNKYIYIESSFKCICGVYITNSIDDIFRFVISKMKIKDYIIYRFNNCNIYGCNIDKYINWICDNGEVIGKGKYYVVHPIELSNIQEKPKFPKDIRNESSDLVLMESSKNNKPERKFKCPYCNQKYTRVKLVDHIDKKHEDMIPQDYTAARIVFNMINHKEVGHCVNCGKETKWNEKTWRYERYCCQECVDAYTKLAKSRMKAKYGKEYILDDPEQQNKMLAGRRISGTYKFSDGGVRTYVGSYELKLLKFLDKVMNYISLDVLTPGPSIEYTFNGEKHFWITDVFIVSANLAIDVKDGGDNPNNREMPEYRAKQKAKEDAIMKDNKYNYLRLTNNNFTQLLLILADMKENMMEDIDKKEYHINEFMAVGAINPPVGINQTDGYIVPCMMNNTFVDVAYTPNRDCKDIYKVNQDNKVEKISRAKFKDMYDDTPLLFGCKKDISEKHKEIMEAYETGKTVHFDFISILLCEGSTELGLDGLLFDNCLIPTIDSMEQFREESIITEESFKHQYLKAVDKDAYFPILDPGLNSVKESLLKDIELQVMQDINGYFVYNPATENRSQSFEELSNIPKYIIDMLK